MMLPGAENCSPSPEKCLILSKLAARLLTYVNGIMISEVKQGLKQFCLCCFPISMKQAEVFSVFSTVYFTLSSVPGKSL